MITQENIPYTADEIKAMVKTIEELHKKYKEALERASKLKVQNPFDTVGQMVENIFPELKESEDERIRKVIYGWIYTQPSQFFDINCFSKEEMLAWLERQGNTNVFDMPKISIKDAVEITSRMQHIEDDIKPIAEFIINYANWNLHKDEWNQPTLTVPLFRVLDALIQRGKPYSECVQNIEKQGEKSTIIDIDKMVMEYSQTKDGDFGLPVNCMIRAYRKGINDALSIALNLEKQGENKPTEDAKKLDTDKVIAWLVANICNFEYYVKLFKKDFGL